MVLTPKVVLAPNPLSVSFGSKLLNSQNLIEFSSLRQCDNPERRRPTGRPGEPPPRTSSQGPFGAGDPLIRLSPLRDDVRLRTTGTADPRPPPAGTGESAQGGGRPGTHLPELQDAHSGGVGAVRAVQGGGVEGAEGRQPGEERVAPQRPGAAGYGQDSRPAVAAAKVRGFTISKT